MAHFLLNFVVEDFHVLQMLIVIIILLYDRFSGAILETAKIKEKAEGILAAEQTADDQY